MTGTRCYDMDMKRVTIEDLKANVDAYLREVRAGECIVLCDDGEAVAELRPAPDGDDGLVIHQATLTPDEARDIAGVTPASEIDIVAILRESRDQR